LPDRTDLIRKAAYTINGRSDLVAPAAPLPVLAAPPAPVVVAEAPAAVGAVEAPISGATVVSFVSSLLH
ncbi:MAG: hypothetical protein GW902_09630, partial [Alphaproteobacteria bacterium]|nr:hypothetical protein [Alphaproteobacteria bacterium]